MLYRFMKRLLWDLHHKKFRQEQNRIISDTYAALSSEYEKKSNEVAMVTRFCETLNEQTCGGVKLYAKKVHGGASKVEFRSAKNLVIQKELADMMTISLATRKREIIYERVTLIQNKKESAASTWKIDQEQLFLLLNFPSFDGVSGIFKKQKEVALLNAGGRLGSYGLFSEPGDMTFASAGIVAALQKKDTISLESIKRESPAINAINTRCNDLWSWMAEDLFHLQKNYHMLPSNIGRLPILNQCDIALNLYEFIRNWSQFNIGEIVAVDGRITNGLVASLAHTLMRKMGLGDLFEWSTSNDWAEWLIDDHDTAVIVAHYVIDENS